MGGGVEILAVRTDDERHRDRRQAQESPLHRCRNRSRVNNIVAQVGTVIDAGDHEVRLVV